jgi:hypothetical protein
LIFEVAKNSNQIAMNLAYGSKPDRLNADEIGVNAFLTRPIRKIAN